MIRFAWPRFAVGVAAVVAGVGVGCVAGGSASSASGVVGAQAGGTPGKCNGAPLTPDADGLVQLPHGWSIQCVRAAAALQQVGTTVVQANVPATSNGCAIPNAPPNTTQIGVTAYRGSGKYTYAVHEKGTAYVIAVIENNSNCVTKSAIHLEPGHQYFWVLEKKKSWLVDAITGVSIQLKRFESCTNIGHQPTTAEPIVDVAMIKSNAEDKKCNHDQKPEGLVGFAVRDTADYAFLRSALHDLVATPIDDQWAIWISCGGDCCFSDI